MATVLPRFICVRYCVTGYHELWWHACSGTSNPVVLQGDAHPSPQNVPSSQASTNFNESHASAMNFYTVRVIRQDKADQTQDQKSLCSDVVCILFIACYHSADVIPKRQSFEMLGVVSHLCARPNGNNKPKRADL